MGNWEKVEEERADMRKQYHKVKKALKECEAKLSTQEGLTITTQEEMVNLRRELDASRQEAMMLGIKNARLAKVVSKTTAKNEKLSSTIYQTATMISSVKFEMSEVRAKLQALRQLAVSSQRPMIKALL